MSILDVVPGCRAAVVVLALVSAVAFFTDAPPPRGRVVVTDTTTEILDVVEFDPGTATLRARSFRTLDAVAATLLGNPSIELVEVQSHTSGIGDGAANQTLSEQRAAAVTRYLVAAGVDSSRLTSEGYGDTEPIARGEPTKNERVAFLILKRTGETAEP